MAAAAILSPPCAMWALDQTFASSAGPVAWGQAGAGPALVLVHGWPWSSVTWHRVIPSLAERFTVYWYDLPGFGQSTLAPTRPPALDVQGEVLVELLHHLDLPRPSVVAHDIGGAVALRAHLLHGAAFARLALMNAVVLSPWGSDFFDHVKAHLAAFAGLPPHIHKVVVCAYIDSALAQPLPAEDYDRLDAPWLNAEGQAAFWRQFALADAALTEAVIPQLGALGCPAAVLWGADDPWIPLSRGAALADKIGVPLRPLDGLGHLPQLERPEVAAPALLQALEV